MSLILDREVKDINLDLNKRMLGNRKDAKTGRLDIRAKYNNGEECNIELQVSPYAYMDKRMLEYWAEMYSNKLDSGKGYEKLKPTISILIADFKLPQLRNLTQYKSVWSLREESHSDLVLTEDIKMYILEIPKILNTQIKKDELALWLKFIENPLNKEVKEVMRSERNKYLEQAEKELGYLSGDPDFKRLVNARVGFLRDQDGFRSEGKKEGKEEEKIEIAKRLLKIKMPLQQIAEITKLTEEEIKRISKK